MQQPANTGDTVGGHSASPVYFLSPPDLDLRQGVRLALWLNYFVSNTTASIQVLTLPAHSYAPLSFLKKH